MEPITSIALGKGAETATSQISSSLVEILIKPRILEYAKKRRINRQVFEHSVYGKFQDYFERAYNQHSSIAVLALRGRVNLKDIYVPLTLVHQDPMNRNYREVRIDSYADSFIPYYRRIMLIDDAGMGKSTLIKFLFLSYIDKAGADGQIPILIELRRLREGMTIESIIKEELKSINKDIDLEFILELIDRGDFIFFLDGYDEIPLADRRSSTEDIRNFTAKANNNQFLISSRKEAALSSFSDFEFFTIKPLSNPEAFQLISNYDPDGEVSVRLIEDIGKQIHVIGEFLTNPMLVTLLYTAYDHTQLLPLKKSSFYRQVYDALFERHDATKPLFKREKRCGLDRDDFERMMRALGIETLKKGVAYSKDELLICIDASKVRCQDLKFGRSDFFDDLLSSVPLFVAEGDLHRWKHKSLQEYFAARFIYEDANSEQETLLKHASSSRQYSNLLDIYYDIDPSLFRRILTYELLHSFINHYSNSYVEIKAANQITKSDIEMRRKLTFGYNFIYCSPVFSKRNHVNHNTTITELSKFLTKIQSDWSTISDKPVPHQNSSVMLGDNSYLFVWETISPATKSVLQKKEPQLWVQRERLELKKFGDSNSIMTTCDLEDLKELRDLAEPLFITDKIDCPVNTPGMFRIFNSVLSNIHDLDLNPAASKKLLGEIEAELNSPRTSLVDLL